MNDILVLGSAAGGTAIANLLADNTKNNLFMVIWKSSQNHKFNDNKKYLPAKKINKNILASSYLPDISINIIFHSYTVTVYLWFF